MIEKLKRGLRKLVQDELDMASKDHGARFNSDHEAAAVLFEELEEAKDCVVDIDGIILLLWQEYVRKDKKPDERALMELEKTAIAGAAELVQVAAMARKWMVSSGADRSDTENKLP